VPAARLEDYAPPSNLDPAARAGLGRASLLAADVAIQAVEDARLPFTAQTAPLVGVAFGTMEGEREKPVPGAPASSVARVLGVAGPLLSLEGPGSGLAALVEGFEMLKRAATPVVVVGAIDTVAASGSTVVPGRPFAAGRSGYSYVEIACAVVLEDAEIVEAREARVYAEVLGGGMAFSRATVMEPSPNYVDTARAMRAALISAEVFQGEVETVFAGAWGDRVADEAEGRAIRDLWGPNADRLTVTSVQGATGFAPAASGLLSLVTALRSLETGIVPPTAGCDKADEPFAPLDIVTTSARAWRYNTVMVNAISEANNVSVILRRA
jgi:3-oxoacyl-(acyl-carrier-protein) synthase